MGTTLHVDRKNKTPRYVIRIHVDGDLKIIYLGGKDFSEQTANELCNVINAIIYNRNNGISTPDKRLAAWLETTSPKIIDKLAAVGLVPKVQTITVTELWNEFMENKSGVKDSTVDLYEYSRDRFFAFFKPDTDIGTLKPLNFEQWKTFLRTEYKSPRNGKPLSEPTVAGTITKVKAIFNWACKMEIMTGNPLRGVSRGSFVNRENDRFIEMGEYRDLLESCFCLDWRVIISLARIGGLRPCEILRLRWIGIHWDKDKFYVTSPKTEHHAGHEGRFVPLFPELRDELGTLFFSSESAGKEFVINRYRTDQNLGTAFARITKKAGVKPIPRPFDNMRASRSCEINDRFDSYKESQWIGHSRKAAFESYLSIRESDFGRAAAWTTETVTSTAPVKQAVTDTDFEQSAAWKTEPVTETATVSNPMERNNDRNPQTKPTPASPPISEPVTQGGEFVVGCFL